MIFQINKFGKFSESLHSLLAVLSVCGGKINLVFVHSPGSVKGEQNGLDRTIQRNASQSATCGVSGLAQDRGKGRRDWGKEGNMSEMVKLAVDFNFQQSLSRIADSTFNQQRSFEKENGFLSYIFLKLTMKRS